MHDLRDSATKAGWTWLLFPGFHVLCGQGQVGVGAAHKLVLGQHTAAQTLLLPTRARFDGMCGSKAASDMEPFWLAAKSTASTMLWAVGVWLV